MGREKLWGGALLLVVATGCGRSGVYAGRTETGSVFDAPLPQGAPDGAQPVATPIVDIGRGLDGAVVFSSSETELDDCQSLLSGGGGQLEFLLPPSVIAAGRRVLVLQMNDAISDSGPTSPVTNFKRAGQWEIAEIAAINGTTATLLAPLSNADYATDIANGFRAQICLVREYTNVTLAAGATVAPRAWDGARGGVLAWLVKGTLTLEGGARLHADASGFRGGFCGSPATVENVTGYDVLATQGGGKGEGLDSRFFHLFGRGAVTNGGGGGNGLNAGGGGGGGFGRGGSGGAQTNASSAGANTSGLVLGEDPSRGLAGGSAETTTRLTLGGGGGAGHLNGAALSRCGGAGGGILFVQTQVLAGTGGVSAIGEVAPRVDRDGAGGSGAGGTIELAAVSASGFAGEISADGGNGGDVDNSSLSTHYGPGGGGGGGRAHAQGVSTAVIHAEGGREGWNTTTRLAWEADNGEPGLVLFP